MDTFNREAKNLTPGHVAAKMSIAQTLVRPLEADQSRPDNQQIVALSDIFWMAAPAIIFAQIAGLDGHEHFQAAGKT